MVGKISSKQKARGSTRQLLMESALKLVAGGQSFSNLSLREVTKETGVVPAAFYRHFSSMEELGNHLVSQSFEVLGKILMDLLSSESILEEDGVHFIKKYIATLKDNIAYLRLVMTEYYGGSNAKLKASVKKEVDVLRANLAIEMSRIYPQKKLARKELLTLADICFDWALICARKVIESYEHQGFQFEHEMDGLLESLAMHLQILLLGIHHWDSARFNADGK